MRSLDALHCNSFKEHEGGGHWQPWNIWLCRSHCLSWSSQHLPWGQVEHRHWHQLSSPYHYLKWKGNQHSQSAGILLVTWCLCRPLCPLSLWGREGFLLPSRLSTSQWLLAIWDIPCVHLCITKMSPGRVLQFEMALCVFFLPPLLLIGYQSQECQHCHPLWSPTKTGRFFSGEW